MGFLTKMFMPKTKQAPTNVNNDLIKSIYTGQAQNGVAGSNFLTSLLTGQGDVAAADAGYQGYLDRAGYQPAMDAMTRSVTGSAAARGLLRSGSTAKALQKSGAELNNQFYNNYLTNLSGLSSLGNQAGQIIAGTGSSDTIKGPSTGGTIGKLIGTGLSLFSDRRLKQDIEHVGTYPNGLPMYEFAYVGQPATRWRGVMAEDVEKKYPEAVGETLDGYKTVDYAMIGISMERAHGPA